MNRRPIRSHGELEAALTQEYPLEMFDSITSRTLVFDHIPEAPYKRGHEVEMSIIRQIGNEYPFEHIDTTIYFPLHLPVDDNDCLLNPLGGVKSEWLKKDMHYAYTGATFLFGTCKIEPRGALTRGIQDVPRISFFVINSAERARSITHIMAIREVRSDATSDDAISWGWNHFDVPNSKGVDYYCRYTRLLKYGRRFRMELYPIGFSFMMTDDDGDYGWGGKFYKTFADLVTAREEYVREECRKILQEWEESGHGSDSEERAPEQETPKMAADLSKPASEMTLAELCISMNARLDVLQREYGMKNLGRYELGTGAFTNEKLSLKRGDAGSHQTRTEALKHVAHMERIAKAYKEYKLDFEVMRKWVEAVEGTVSTEDIQYAEFEMPQVGAFGEKESPKRIIRFSYSARGVIDAMDWLKDEEDAYRTSVMKVREMREDRGQAANG